MPKVTEAIPAGRSVDIAADGAKRAGEADDGQPRRTARTDETIAWLAGHPEILDGFGDEWVAVADRRVVAHDPSMVEVVREARHQGFADALLVPAIPSPFVSSL